jgi:hypothetical protein
VRALGAALVSVAAVATLATCGGGAAAAPVACAPGGAQVKLADRHGQVYTLHRAVYGCDRHTRMTTKLGVTTSCVAVARVDHLALSGDVVAYGLDRCGVDTGFTTVITRRLSDGKQLRNLAAVTGPGLVESYQSLGSLVVTPKGAVAWIATEHSIIGHGTRIEVHAGGKLLDSGPGIVASSLRLHRSTLTWRDGGATRSAAI